MKNWSYRILNVFAESTFGGNPLCVFEDARGLSDQQMQLLARQFNLSETTFILPVDSLVNSSANSATSADVRVRIFTPGFEMPFAGHPTLGTAQVVADLLRARASGDAPCVSNTVTLQMKAGLVPVVGRHDRWTLTAPGGAAPAVRVEPMGRASMAALMGLNAEDVAGDPMWIDTGSEQLLVPLVSAEAVDRAQPIDLPKWPANNRGARMASLFHVAANTTASSSDGAAIDVYSRFFFAKNGSVEEDPGTGSACANLGGWLKATEHPSVSTARLPAGYRIRQGVKMDRPCVLSLRIEVDGRVLVGGRVVEMGRGQIQLPAEH